MVSIWKRARLLFECEVNRAKVELVGTFALQIGKFGVKGQEDVKNECKIKSLII